MCNFLKPLTNIIHLLWKKVPPAILALILGLLWKKVASTRTRARCCGRPPPSPPLQCEAPAPAPADDVRGATAAVLLRVARRWTGAIRSPTRCPTRSAAPVDKNFHHAAPCSPFLRWDFQIFKNKGPPCNCCRTTTVLKSSCTIQMEEKQIERTCGWCSLTMSLPNQRRVVKMLECQHEFWT